MKLKLDKKTIQKVAIFSSALTLVPTNAYAAAPNMESIPQSLGAYVLVFGGLVLATYREIKKEERKRLYEIEENLIPAQKKAIQYLKSTKNKKNKRRLKYEIDSEKAYLDYLKEKKSTLCEKLNIDEFDDEQMETFIEEERKRHEENTITKSKDKIKALLIR